MLNVVAAVELVQKLGKDKDSGHRYSNAQAKTQFCLPGSKVATILCDGAFRYQSHLESKGLGHATPGRKYAVLD